MGYMAFGGPLQRIYSNNPSSSKMATITKIICFLKMGYVSTL
jgi:hypothetical protein